MHVTPFVPHGRERVNATDPPPRVRIYGANVGRLLAPGRLARLPGPRGPVAVLSGRSTTCPIQWRGRAGILPASVSRVRLQLCGESYRRPSRLASAAERRPLRRARAK